MAKVEVEEVLGAVEAVLWVGVAGGGRRQVR